MSAMKTFTAAQVSTHTTRKDCWMTKDGKVYDFTSFLLDHPGGDDLVLKYAGKDLEGVMDDFNEHDHSEEAYEMMVEYCIGTLVAEPEVLPEEPAEVTPAELAATEKAAQEMPSKAAGSWWSAAPTSWLAGAAVTAVAAPLAVLPAFARRT